MPFAKKKRMSLEPAERSEPALVSRKGGRRMAEDLHTKKRNTNNATGSQAPISAQEEARKAAWRNGGGYAILVNRRLRVA